MSEPQTNWNVPGSVISALWGSVMPRVAAAIWADEKANSPIHDKHTQTLDPDQLEKLWTLLAEISFGSVDKWESLRGDLGATPQKDKPGFTNLQRSSHVVLEYFHPAKKHDGRIPFTLSREPGYDFILHERGLDVFIPNTPMAAPGKDTPEYGATQILKLYKFRKTGAPPIGIPRAKTGAIPVRNLTAPTGTSQAQKEWVQENAGKTAWWITGAVYRGIMTEYPRIVASMWYEELVWPDSEGDSSYRKRFDNGLKELLEERLEVELPPKFAVKVDAGEGTDVTCTNEGLVFVSPGAAPDWDELLEAIMDGKAGNPVFTDTGA